MSMINVIAEQANAYGIGYKTAKNGSLYNGNDRMYWEATPCAGDTTIEIYYRVGGIKKVETYKNAKRAFVRVYEIGRNIK